MSIVIKDMDVLQLILELLIDSFQLFLADTLRELLPWSRYDSSAVNYDVVLPVCLWFTY